VLDVGCGTGIVARQLRDAGATVLGVEPDARMAAFARASGVDCEVATFETWDPAGRGFDAVTAGQSWHWIDPAIGTAKAAEVLRPGGLLALFAHVFDPPVSVAEATAAALKRLVPDSPFTNLPPRSPLQIYQAMFDGFNDAIGGSDSFATPQLWRFDWERSYTRDQWLDVLPTTGAFTRLAPDMLHELLSAVATAIDSIGGQFTMTYTTLTLAAITS
jgi:SAM-dependent methyltransferase